MRLVIVLLLGLALAGCDRQKGDTPQGGGPEARTGEMAVPKGVETGLLDRSHAGTPAPDVAFRKPDGGAAKFADFRGKPLLVNLWATWCAPCIAEMPTLDALAASGGAVKVLALSQDSAGKEKVDAFFTGKDFKALEPYFEPELEVMAQLKLDTLPTTILYDKNGKEVWRMVGMVNWTGDRAARLLKEAGA